MEIDILDSLEDLGYSGPLKDQKVLEEILKAGLAKTEYTDLVTWLAGEIHDLLDLESTITASPDPADPLNFLLELSSFLKELNCPHRALLDGTLEQRLDSFDSRLLLLDYLCGELLTARILASQRKDESHIWEVEMESSSMAEELESLAHLLGLQDSASQVETSHQLLESLHAKLEEKLKKVGALPKPLLGPDFGPLTEDHWDQLSKLNSVFKSDYGLRREMLLTRLDATIRTFSWSDRLKDKHDKITAAFLPIRSKLHMQPNVHLGDLLGAREDLLLVEKTSSSQVRQNTKSSVNKVLIGAVPDRGGRPEEQNPPPPEMPPWQKRGQQQRGGFQGGRGGGFQGGRGGGFQGGRGGGGNFQSQGRGGGNWSKSNYNSNDRDRGHIGGGGYYGRGGGRSDSYYGNRDGGRRKY